MKKKRFLSILLSATMVASFAVPLQAEGIIDFAPTGTGNNSIIDSVNGGGPVIPPGCACGRSCPSNWWCPIIQGVLGFCPC